MQKQKKHSRNIKIGVDLMGCDTSPKDLLKDLSLFAASVKDDVHFVAFASKDIPLTLDASVPNVELILSENWISLEEDPLVAIRRKKESSLAIGMKLLKEKKIDALVSPGNTGALMGLAQILLDLLPSITKPALLSLVPTKNKHVAVLDVGANISCTKDHLMQFAKMGIAFQKHRGCKKPIVGLLNIGSEEKKGTSEHKKAYKLMKELPGDFFFKGNIEGNEVFEGDLDVLVTDGFTGNVFLKTAEGITSFILDRLFENVSKKDCFHGLLNDLQKHLHYANYPGALLCGVNGIVIKCHSYSNAKAFISAVKGAVIFAKTNLIASLKNSL